MHYEYLPTELVGQIFLSCTSTADTLALSATCRRYSEIFNKRRLAFLTSAAEHQHGPLHDSIQLLTHNDSQPAHVVRNVPVNLALLKQLVDVGKVAAKWTDLYPFKRWKYDFEDRRLLSAAEKYRIRRAVYRLWLYGLAFHDRSHTRETRLHKLVVQERTRLLHNWPTAELVEMADVRRVMRDVVAENVCPSNGTVARKWRKRFPEDSNPHPLMFNIHLNYPPIGRVGSVRPVSEFHNPYSNLAGGGNDYRLHPRSTVSWSKYQPTRFYDPGSEGWGDDISHYYVVEDVLKLDPAQILFLKEHVKFKRDVEAWLRYFAAGGAVPAAATTTLDGALSGLTVGAEAGPASFATNGFSDVECFQEWAWFDNNGETWSETLRLVLDERNVDFAEVLGEDGLGFAGSWGVVRDEEDS